MNVSPKTPLALASAAVVGLMSVVSAAADVEVRGAVTPLNGSFLFEFSIENSGPDDYVLLSIVDAPLGDPLIDASLTWPAGFLASYDSGLGFVDFLADADLFSAGSLVTGFSFESASKNQSFFQFFEALDSEGGVVEGRIIYASSVPDSFPVGWLAGVLTLAAAGLRHRLLQRGSHSS